MCKLPWGVGASRIGSCDLITNEICNGKYCDEFCGTLETCTLLLFGKFCRILSFWTSQIHVVAVTLSYYVELNAISFFRILQERSTLIYVQLTQNFSVAWISF